MVSVILPTYNRAHLLPESIESVLSQGYTDLELIIMDDGSTDDTRDLLSGIRDDRIKYYPMPHTGYTSRLKNFAIGQSSGDLLAFIDSDDTWKAGKLEKQVRLLNENPSIGFSLTDVTTFRGDTILIDHSYHLLNTVQCLNIFHWMEQSRFIVYNPTLIFRKGCLARTGYFDESMRSGDYHFNMRLAYHFDAGIFFDPLVMRRVHDSNMSEQIPFENYTEYLETFGYLYKAGMTRRRYFQKARANAHYKMGLLHEGNGDREQARLHFLSSLRINPLQLKCLRRLLKSGGNG
ncbi:MAG: glycosyltransferase [Puia sp.]|nr:glycosyltransferase [Puia sp.]